jgi:hypothetical protein
LEAQKREVAAQLHKVALSARTVGPWVLSEAKKGCWRMLLDEPLKIALLIGYEMELY